MRVYHFGVAFLLILLIRFFFISTYKVSSSSMKPILEEGDHLLSINLDYVPLQLKLGNIIIFYSQSFSELFIKRISRVYSFHYEIVSDNPLGLDSKTLGKIERENIKAYPFFIYYPVNHIGFINR